MAMTETLSPSSEGILQPPSAEPAISTSVECEAYQKQEVDFTSAPEIDGADGGACDAQQAVKQGRGKRKKRRTSFSENHNSGSGHQNWKRRRGNRQAGTGGRIILPTNFLLGGNINDPLNLNSMMDENVNRALNAVTPSSSPLPPRSSVIHIVTPEDVTDPLGLNSSDFATPDAPGEFQRNKGRRKRRRKSHAAKPQQRQSSDTASNSDDQKLIAADEAELDNAGELYATVAVENARKSGSQNRRKKRSPFAGIGHLSVPIPQASIKDPIVSPAVPQNTRRFRSSFGSSKQRRRKNGGGGKSTIDAGIQTDSSEMLLEETLRCGSEKIPNNRGFFSPIKRRRTVSENWVSPAHWAVDEDSSKARIRSFFAESPTKKHIDNLLPKTIGSSVKDEAEDVASGRSPAQEYMNKERKRASADKKQTPPSGKKSPSSREQRRERKQSQAKQTVTGDEDKNKSPASVKPCTAKFQYGNYSRYYGYRNHEKFKDVRMDCLKKEWFKEKDVLDIGCNAGHLTLLIARDYFPRKIVGIDIDDGLIRAARNNIRHYASTKKSVPKFPTSMAVSLGPLISPPIETGKDETTAAFPNNVSFFQGNYVPQKDEFLCFQEPEYDVIMCMSVSKWVHLNWGDEGLARMFRRVFKQLRAGGIFILEPQQWKSYTKKRKTCEKLRENCRCIKIRPDSFPNFLMREIGFERVEHVNSQKKNRGPGFQRPIQVYYKPE